MPTPRGPQTFPNRSIHKAITHRTCQSAIGVEPVNFACTVADKAELFSAGELDEVL